MLPPGKHAASAEMASVSPRRVPVTVETRWWTWARRFQLKHLGNHDASEFTDLPEIVAQQIGDHHQFGDLLGGGLEFERRAAVVVGIRESRPGALDRTRLNAMSGDFQERFRRGAEDFPPVKREPGGHRRGRSIPERFVEWKQRAAGHPGGERLGQIGLIDIAGFDPSLDARDLAEKGFAGDRRTEGTDLEWLGRIGAQVFREPPAFPPGLVRVAEDQHFRIVAEDKRAFVVHPSAEPAKRETVISRDDPGPGQRVAKHGAVRRRMDRAAEDPFRTRRDH